MELIEIYPVGAESTQAIFYCLHHVLWAGALWPIAHRAAELRCDHHLVTAPTERAAQVLFARGTTVDVGSIEEGDASIEGGINDRRGSLRVGAPTELLRPRDLRPTLPEILFAVSP